MAHKTIYTITVSIDHHDELHFKNDKGGPLFWWVHREAAQNPGPTRFVVDHEPPRHGYPRDYGSYNFQFPNSNDGATSNRYQLDEADVMPSYNTEFYCTVEGRDWSKVLADPLANPEGIVAIFDPDAGRGDYTISLIFLSNIEYES